MKNGVLFENIRISLQSVRSQMLRTILTGLIIAIGIMALVGILTSIDVIKASLTGQFALMGANTFTIRNVQSDIQIGQNGKKPQIFAPISYYEALEFKNKFPRQEGTVSVSYIASGIAEVTHKNEKTNPNIAIWASDENYVKTGGYEIEDGRNITASDVALASPIALIGQEVKDQIFKSKDPVGEFIEIGGTRYKVVGLLKEKGSAMGFGGDKSVFIPISKARSQFSRSSQSFSVSVMAPNGGSLEKSVEEATIVMRKVRRLKPREKSNFGIIKSDSLSETLLEKLEYVTLAAVLIGAITLFGAAIALMNIMLVSVTERTREIGIRKAIGAKSIVIRRQFLTEAIIICLLGGLAGIILGILIGNLTSMMFDGQFIVPWQWIMASIALCFVVGLISGLYPAYKASRLDPIESLRYE
ncbi:MAG: ABC transporter permease [Owenweeksia sp.]